ncbi:hypothetical protein [Mycetocola sp. JXN-3]|uniref:hypothetical protein n=1 Tax=Mycetocola sp. JXN-3 TaxID=2116510 RepID=UPI00165CF918|nr:hypothetical protein [Mycetocola sp. JXN-3]
MAKWQADLTACLKKKGVDLPPQPTAKGGSGTGTELAAIDPGTVDLDALSAASRECTKTIGQPPINPDKSGRKELEALQKKQVIFAKCMRDAGYNFPDPEPLPDEENGAMSGSVAAPVRPGDYDEKTMKECGAKAGFDQKGAN